MVVKQAVIAGAPIYLTPKSNPFLPLVSEAVRTLQLPLSFPVACCQGEAGGLMPGEGAELKPSFWGIGGHYSHPNTRLLEKGFSSVHVSREQKALGLSNPEGPAPAGGARQSLCGLRGFQSRQRTQRPRVPVPVPVPLLRLRALTSASSTLLGARCSPGTFCRGPDPSQLSSDLIW